MSLGHGEGMEVLPGPQQVGLGLGSDLCTQEGHQKPRTVTGGIKRGLRPEGGLPSLVGQGPSWGEARDCVWTLRVGSWVSPAYPESRPVWGTLAQGLVARWRLG